MAKEKRKANIQAGDGWLSSDKEINDVSKPLHIPSRFSDQDSAFDQIVYTLGYLMEASVEQVGAKWVALGNKQTSDDVLRQVEQTLEKLSEMGKIGKKKQTGATLYHLHKETHAHTGSVKP